MFVYPNGRTSFALGISRKLLLAFTACFFSRFQFMRACWIGACSLARVNKCSWLLQIYAIGEMTHIIRIPIKTIPLHTNFINNFHTLPHKSHCKMVVEQFYQILSCKNVNILWLTLTIMTRLKLNYVRIVFKCKLKITIKTRKGLENFN